MKNKSFRCLWVGQILADSGDVIYIVGLISMLYKVTGSAFYMSVIPFTITVARFISGLVTPILIDKYPLRTLLVRSQAGKTVLLLFLGGYNLLGLPIFSIWPIFILVFVISYLEGFAFPASKALIPRLVSNEELVKANSFLSILNQFVGLGGWACGGILAAVLHGENLVWLTFILYILSTLVLSCISDDKEVIDKKIGTLENEPNSIRTSIKEDWAFIWKSPILRLIHIILSFESMAYVVWIAAIIYVYVKEQLKMDESWWGYINASFLFGLLIGGFFSLRSSNFIERNMGRIIISSAIGISLTTFLFGFIEIPIFSLVISTIFGVIEELKGISLQTLLQKSTSNELLPKVYAAQGSLTSILFGISSLIFGVITEQFGVKVTFMISTVLLLFSACYTVYFRKYLGEQNNIHQEN